MSQGPEKTPETTIDQFLAIDIRVGTVIDAKPFEKARRPAYIMHIDFGDDIGVKKTSAQITALYEPSELIGKQVAAVVNFPPRQIGPVMSEVLTLGFSDENNDVVLIHPERPVPNGQRMH